MMNVCEENLQQSFTYISIFFMAKGTSWLFFKHGVCRRGNISPHTVIGHDRWTLDTFRKILTNKKMSFFCLKLLVSLQPESKHTWLVTTHSHGPVTPATAGRRGHMSSEARQGSKVGSPLMITCWTAPLQLSLFVCVAAVTVQQAVALETHTHTLPVITMPTSPILWPWAQK